MTGSASPAAARCFPRPPHGMMRLGKGLAFRPENTMHSRPAFVLVAALVLAAASGATAQNAPPRMALDVEPGTRTSCRSVGNDLRAYALLFPLVSPAVLHRCDAMDESVSRRIQANLEPMLENLGYAIERVTDGRKAMSDGRDAPDFSASLRLDVEAKPVYLVHEALRYDREEIRDAEVGVAAWGRYEFWWRDGDLISKTHGVIGPFESQVTQGPGGRATIDDEESVARVFAGEVARAVDESLRGVESVPQQASRPAVVTRRGRVLSVEPSPEPRRTRQPKVRAGRGEDWDRWRRE